MNWLSCLAMLFAPAGMEPAVAEKPIRTESAAVERDGRTVIVLLGEPRGPVPHRLLTQSAERWEQAARRGGARAVVIGRDESGTESDHDRFLAALQTAVDSRWEFWIVCLAPATDTTHAPALNLRGDDLPLHEFAAALASARQPVAIVCGAAPRDTIVKALSGANRAIVTAGESGPVDEVRLLVILSYAIGEPKADLDKDGQVSLLEAWLASTHRAREVARAENRPFTLQSQLDDNADRAGSPPDWYQGTRSTRRLSAGSVPDGLRAARLHLIRNPEEANRSLEFRRKREELEQALDALRQRKAELPAVRYQRELEAILLELAALYAEDEPARLQNAARSSQRR